MDNFDRDCYAEAYRKLADVLGRERKDEVEDHLSFRLGDLARRVFVGSKFIPPDDLLEMAAHAIRSDDQDERQKTAELLRSHAVHLDELDDDATNTA